MITRARARSSKLDLDVFGPRRRSHVPVVHMTQSGPFALHPVITVKRACCFSPWSSQAGPLKLDYKRRTSQLTPELARQGIPRKKSTPTPCIHPGLAHAWPPRFAAAPGSHGMSSQTRNSDVLSGLGCCCCGAAVPQQSRAVQSDSEHSRGMCHLCGWIERIPGGTRQNDGLGTGIMGAAAARLAYIRCPAEGRLPEQGEA